ncbi:hypothetical protein JCM10212_001820 [Sporobolomyces blumeae]
MSTPPATCQDCLPTDDQHRQPTRSSDPLVDPQSFVPPDLSEASTSECPRVVIEFCDRCRWLHRATWTQTELFLTFPPTSPPSEPPAPASNDETSTTSPTSGPGLRSITLVPRNSPDTGGRFRVWVYRDLPTGARREENQEASRGWELVWDRKVEGGFPEMKVLKQRIRNLIAPEQALGHSDKPAKTTPPT